MKPKRVLELFYPRNDDQPDTLEINLVDVRASDGIQITYDFDRDGWVIKQPKEELIDNQLEETWHEVAFLQAWGLKSNV